MVSTRDLTISCAGLSLAADIAPSLYFLLRDGSRDFSRRHIAIGSIGKVHGPWVLGYVAAAHMMRARLGAHPGDLMTVEAEAQVFILRGQGSG